MNTASKTPSRAASYLRALTGLLLISGAATLAVTWMEQTTRADIAANEQAHELAILATALPAGNYDVRQEGDFSLASAT